MVLPHPVQYRVVTGILCAISPDGRAKGGGVELSGYLAVARRWWWTLLVATWVAGVSGYVVASQIPPTYEAETQLLVGPYNTDRDTLAAAGDLVQTYSQLLTTTRPLETGITDSGPGITPADLGVAKRVTAK